MNKIEKLEDAYNKLDEVFTAVEPGMLDDEPKKFSVALSYIKEVADELKHEATLC